MTELSCFISPHGYGHATRCIGVLESLLQRRPDLKIKIFTTVPRSLFDQNLENFHYHKLKVDIGLVQASALKIDLARTIAELDGFYPFDDKMLDEVAACCCNSSAIICDIAPLGIAVARRCAIPSILVENFTWDWIYTYCKESGKNNSSIQKHIDYLQKLFTKASCHIQTEPLCHRDSSAFLCGPIFRKKKTSAGDIKKQLGCSGSKLVVVTMGGIAQKLPELHHLAQLDEFTFLFTGQDVEKKIGDNILFLSRQSQAYHPDIIGGADIVVCKAGYSTVAECAQAGARVISIGRPGFAEIAVLQNYLEKTLQGITMEPEQYLLGDWSTLLKSLMDLPKPPPASKNGADTAAEFILHHLSSTSHDFFD